MYVRAFARQWRGPGFGLTCLLLVVATHSDCVRVGDNVAGPGGVLPPTPYASCIRHCEAAADMLRDEENALHELNLIACDGDPNCIAEEMARHEVALMKIAGEEADCLTQCHNQGGGRGGQ